MEPSPAARLLQMLSLFTSRPQWTGNELADRMGITTRTVRRDIAQLREIGYPIEADAGRAGGYRLGVGGRLPPLLLTDDEAVAVAVGLRAATSRGVAGDDEAAVAAMAKLEQVLPPALRERVAALRDVTVLVRERGEPLVDPDVLVTIAQGCRRAERLRFEYRAGDGAETSRRVEPYGLVNMIRRWYAVVYDLDRDDWRTFRVDRMSGVELTGHTFERRADPDVEGMVLAGMSRHPYDVHAEVLLHTSREAAVREIPRSVGEIEDTDDGPVLHISANEPDWIARYLAGLPFEVEVRAPAELRDEIRRIGERLVTRHSLADGSAAR